MTEQEKNVLLIMAEKAKAEHKRACKKNKMLQISRPRSNAYKCANKDLIRAGAKLNQMIDVLSEFDLLETYQNLSK